MLELAFVAILHVGVFCGYWLYAEGLMETVLPKAAITVISNRIFVMTMLSIATICVFGFVAYIIYEDRHRPRSGDSGHNFTVPIIVYLLTVFGTFDLVPSIISVRRNIRKLCVASGALNTIILTGTLIGIVVQFL